MRIIIRREKFQLSGDTPCEYNIVSRCIWSCQLLSGMRFVDVLEDKSGSGYRCTAVLYEQNWLDSR